MTQPSQFSDIGAAFKHILDGNGGAGVRVNLNAPADGTGNPILDAALAYARFGWSVLADCPPDHQGMSEEHIKTCENPGKRPWGKWKVYQDRRATDGELLAKWRRLPNLNVGMALGPVSGVVRIDSDGPAAESRLAELSKGDLPITLEFTSGRENGGRGLLYAIPDGIELRTTTHQSGEKQELRFQAKGAQTVLPPSRHPSGCLYTWVTGRSPWEIPAAPMPAWLIEQLIVKPPDTKPHTRSRFAGYTTDGSNIVRRCRNYLAKMPRSVAKSGGHDAMFDACLAIYRGFALDGTEAEDLVRWFNSEKCDPPWSDRELQHKTDNARNSSRVPLGYLRDQPNPNGYHFGERMNGDHAAATAQRNEDKPHLTDLGNAQRLVREHGADLRFCHPWKRWLVWDGQRWRLDDSGEAMRRAKASVKRQYAEAQALIEELRNTPADEDADDSRKKKLAAALQLLTHATKSEDARALSRMLELAKSEPGIPVSPSDLDGHSWLFNCTNGTIDLRTGTLQPHRRENLITKLCPTTFDANAKCSRFLEALDAIHDNDEDIIEYQQRFLGYALTGETSEQILPTWWGAGANGKSTINNAITEAVGADYAGMTPAELLMETHGNQHPTILADLHGKRLMVAAEIDQGRRLNESRLKVLTGGDAIKARRCNENFWQFQPTHKLILIANHKPTVAGCDHAVWRRLRLVPFTVAFLDPDAPENAGKNIPADRLIDRKLPQALRAEHSGILAWLVRGCLNWQEHGLPTPKTIQDATAEYRDEQDIMAAFIAETCTVGSTLYRCRFSDLYTRYAKWAEAAGEKSMTKTAFGLALIERGYERFQSNGVWYKGLALTAANKTPDEQADGDEP